MLGIFAGDTFEVEIFYDGGCSLCTREVRLLVKLDRRRGRIRFTDIMTPEFEAASLGITTEALLARIHGRLVDGTWIEGVEVFRRAYAAIGLRWVIPLTRLPGVRSILEVGYVRFARWRYRRRKRTGAVASLGARSKEVDPGPAPPLSATTPPRAHE